MITIEQLKRIMPHSSDTRRKTLIAPLNAAMTEFGITTPCRQAAFLAQIAHETGSLQYMAEIASGKAYEGRKDLGNIHPGDGPRFKGRGLFQLTGRANYAEYSKALYGDEKILLEHPEKLEYPTDACRSAALYWYRNGLSALADTGDFVKITKRINGGTKGLADRQAFYAVAKEVLACP